MNTALILIGFVITAFGQPAWVAGCGILAAAFGFALFWKGMLSVRNRRNRFLICLVWFGGVQGIQLSWMTAMDYMGPLILALYFFLILMMGLQFGLMSLWIDESICAARAAAIAGAWVIFEWVRLFFLCGFTWNPAGLALAGSSYSLQFASVGGIFGLSFWVILVNLAALKAWLNPSIRQNAVWILLALFPHFFGVLHQQWVESYLTPSKTLRVALVHTNMSPEQKDFVPTEPSSYIPPLVQWNRILEALPEEPVDLIVFPEAALPMGAHHAIYELQAMENYLNSKYFPPLRSPYAVYDRGDWKVSNVFVLQTLANQYDAHVISGLDDHDAGGKYNAAFHFCPANRPYERYEKQILVPVGEYIPFRSWKRWSQFIARQFGIYSSFDPGTDGKVFSAQIPIGISICVEETFSSLIRGLRVKGAELFVNVTNDAWFPHSKLARQHFDHGRVRAAENGVSILRACNCGISGGIDCFGRSTQIVSESEKTRALCFSVPVGSYRTLYTWWGDGAILGLSLGCIFGYSLFRKKKLP